MKSIYVSKRSIAIAGILAIALSIVAISKKVISYPTGSCMKGTQELTLNKGINKFIIKKTSSSIKKFKFCLFKIKLVLK